MCHSHNPRVIDKCMRECIRTLKVIFNSANFEVVACCCGHGKYPMTIVYKLPIKMFMPMELFSGKAIPRKKRFYKKDKEGYYYIPETLL